MQALHQRLALDPASLRHQVDPQVLGFTTTAEIEPSRSTIGQPRATNAISFGLEIKSDGYNIFVAGQPGSGRESTIVDTLAEYAPNLASPSDWVYVFNFDDPDRPNAIRLPAGLAARFADDMLECIKAVKREIVRVFESEAYDRQRRSLLEDVAQQRAAHFEQLGNLATESGFHLEISPAGIMSFPLLDGKPMPPEAFAALPEESRAEYESRSRELQQEIARTMRSVRLLDKSAAAQMAQLDQSTAMFAVDPIFAELKAQYSAEREVVAHIEQVRADVLNRYQELIQADVQERLAAEQGSELGIFNALTRYDVNVLIDNGSTDGAPTVVERHPTYYNLLGRVNYRSTPGMMVTDFRQIKPGALHRANGGFLILHVDDLLGQPFAWDALKRALLCREIRIENMGEQYTAVPAATLRPEPIPLDLKVILIGSREIYHLLYKLDESFEELFRVKAEFAPDMSWNDDHVRQYIAFISRYIRDNSLRHLDSAAAARLIEYGARLRERNDKLSTRMIDIANVLTEASHWASKRDHDTVAVEDVDTAIRQRKYRSDLVEERMQELIAEGTIDIDTSGARIGQLNGVAIIDIGDHTFGYPSRISARVSLGNGEIQSIERAIKLSGPIHSKGFLILAGYLAGQYAGSTPLAVNATITFEQTYDEVEGDSASSAELYALLSALADVPIRQGVAVTGAVDQYGRIHAVGGVTHKIEGFFEVAKASGLDGSHGMLIPGANVRNLMLSEEVIAAVERGLFTIWAVNTLDEGIELLTDMPAGVRQPDGRFPEDSIHGRVEAAVRRYADTARSYSLKGNGVKAESPDDQLVTLA